MMSIVHTLVLPAPRDAVWAALTTNAGLRRWLCPDAQIEPVVGGELRLDSAPGRGSVFIQR